MKIRIASDLHLDFFEPDEKIDYERLILSVNEDSKENEILLIPGDTLELTKRNHPRLLDFFQFCSDNFYQTIAICGNHEYFNTSFEAIEESELWEMRHYFHNVQLAITDGVYGIFPENGKNVAIITSTLWTDFENNNILSKLVSKDVMNDFRIIEYKGRIFNPDDAYEMNQQAREHIKRELNLHAKSDFYLIDHIVVLTHHSPSMLSTSTQFKGSDLNGAFSNTGIEEEILLNDEIKRKPILWVHGHLHNSSDYMIGDTRIVCNPFGYWRGFKNENSDYSKDLVINL